MAKVTIELTDADDGNVDLITEFDPPAGSDDAEDSGAHWSAGVMLNALTSALEYSHD